MLVLPATDQNMQACTGMHSLIMSLFHSSNCKVKYESRLHPLTQSQDDTQNQNTCSRILCMNWNIRSIELTPAFVDIDRNTKTGRIISQGLRCEGLWNNSRKETKDYSNINISIHRTKTQTKKTTLRIHGAIDGLQNAWLLFAFNNNLGISGNKKLPTRKNYANLNVLSQECFV